jgi:hypothetical protein
MAPRLHSPKKEGENTTGANPIKSDAELSGLLKRLDKVKKYKTFDRWKTKFLGRLDTLVYEKGIAPAQKTCDDFSKVLKTTVKCATKVTGHVEKGELSTEKKTVKASLALSELGTNLTSTVDKLEQLIPSTGKNEEKMGYTKFHLGAVLIRQGFHQYITMKQIEDALLEIASKVGDVADKQQLDLFTAYKVQFQRFCDIMADLNLYDVMMKCVEFAEAPGEEESSDEESMMISLEVETAVDGIKTIMLEVEPSDTIGSIKEMIAEDIGIPTGKQVFKFQGKELTDPAQTLGKAGIQDGSVLTVEALLTPVTVKTHNGKDITLMVDPDMYLSDLKRLVAPESGIPPEKQNLFVNDTMQELNNDNLKLSECELVGVWCFYVQPTSITLHVEMPNGTIEEVIVELSDTPEQIKAKIQETTGMAPSEQVLKYQGEEMPDEKTIKDMGMNDGDTVQVDILKVPVSVTTKDGKTFELMVAPTDTLGDIKKQLQDETGLAVDQQILSLTGNELSEDGTLAKDLGITAGTTLTLSPRAMKIRIELPDGTQYTMEIDAMDTSSDMEAKIAKTDGLAAFLGVGSTGALEVHASKVFGK